MADLTLPTSGQQESGSWQNAVAAIPADAFDPVSSAKFTVRPTEPVAVAGGTFARAIGARLGGSGFNFLQQEPPASGAIPGLSARVMLRTTRQLRQSMLTAYGLMRPVHRAWRRSDGRYIDPFRPDLTADGFATASDVADAQRAHHAAMRRTFQTCRAFLCILEGAEIFLSPDGAALPAHPELFQAEAPEGAPELHTLTAADMRDDLAAFLADLTAVNPGVRLVLGVSPMPLATSHAAGHILLANTYGKAALRVATADIGGGHERAAYFPFYEIVTAPQSRGAYFADDYREITPAGLDHAMRLFTTHMLDSQAAPSGYATEAGAAPPVAAAPAITPAAETEPPPPGLPVEIDFRRGGAGHDLLVAGWSYAEPEYTWTLGGQAFIRLPVPDITCDCTLKFRAGPMVRLGSVNFQRLRLEVNGTIVASLVARQPTQYDVLVPAEILRGRDAVDIVLHLPDAATPSADPASGDKRQLGLFLSSLRFEALLEGPQFAAPALPSADSAEQTTIASVADDRAIMMRLQSLGTNCELGFVQRAHGAEPLGLFRWASTPLPGLLAALTARFEGLGKPENLAVQADAATEFQVIDKKFGFRNHSFAFARDGATETEVRTRELVRLPFLARMMVEDLEQADKLFCFHDAGHSGLDAIERLLAALRAYGPNTLLWVCPAGAGAQAGTAQRIHQNLICAYIDQFQPLGDVNHPSPSWAPAVKAAWSIWRG